MQEGVWNEYDMKNGVDNKGFESPSAGFTLVEVSLAVLVIGIGLLAIFSLFPSGLRAIEEDSADTRCGLFAETVLNGIRGNSLSITNWDDWRNGSTVSLDLRENVLTAISTGTVAELQFPAEGDDWLRYRLTLNTANSNLYWALLEVEDGRYPSGGFIHQNKFYTEFYYQGK